MRNELLMARPIPDRDLRAIEAVVGRHPQGISAGNLARELGQELSRRTLQYRLKYLVDRQRLVREGDRRWASYRLPAHDQAGTREDRGTYAVGGPADGGELMVYETPDGESSVTVRIEGETVWLSQQQMAELFDSSSDNIGLHLKNIFSDNELDEAATTEEFSVVRREGKRQVRRRLKHYNLDAAISVGYRVNSRRGVHFRQWATRTLRDHLLRGYTLNERRLAERGLDEVRQTLDLLALTLKTHDLVVDTGRAVLDLIRRYAGTWRLLLEYDEDRLELPSDKKPSVGVLDHEHATRAIEELKRELTTRNEASSLFGNPRDGMLEGILGSIEQTMFGEPLYGSVQEKAAHLLYFIVKDHPFTDGNKRIGSFLFMLYLQQQDLTPKLNPAGLTALTLLIAGSAPSSKDLMIRLIVNLL